MLPKDDPYIITAEKALVGISEAGAPGAFLVDTLPICASFTHAISIRQFREETVKYIPEWFPGAGFQRKAKVWRQCEEEMHIRPFEAVKNAMVNLLLTIHSFRCYP